VAVAPPRPQAAGGPEGGVEGGRSHVVPEEGDPCREDEGDGRWKMRREVEEAMGGMLPLSCESRDMQTLH
jgi:hypothetical protein